jgi:hypothetical protein
MSANLDDAIKKLNDQNVQKRLRSAMRAATIRALAEEGIKLTPEQWGELTARLIAAKDTPETASFWDDILKNLPPVVGPIIGALSDSRLKTNIVHRETLTNGLRICEFSYAGFSNRWKGVRAGRPFDLPGRCFRRRDRISRGRLPQAARFVAGGVGSRRAGIVLSHRSEDQALTGSYAQDARHTHRSRAGHSLRITTPYG